MYCCTLNCLLRFMYSFNFIWIISLIIHIVADVELGDPGITRSSASCCKLAQIDLFSTMPCAKASWYLTVKSCKTKVKSCIFRRDVQVKTQQVPMHQNHQNCEQLQTAIHSAAKPSMQKEMKREAHWPKLISKRYILVCKHVCALWL